MITQFISTLVTGFLVREVAQVLPLIEAKLPGFLRGFAEKVLATDKVKGWIAEGEKDAAAWLAKMAGTGLAELELWVMTHVKGNLGAALKEAIAANSGVLHLSADEVRKAQALSLAGKLDEALDSELTKLGLAT